MRGQDSDRKGNFIDERHLTAGCSQSPTNPALADPDVRVLKGRMGKVYKDKVLTETVRPAGDLLSGITTGTWQEDYSLRQVEFEWIKNTKPMTFIWANSILLTTLGFGLNLLAKGYSNLTSNSAPISKGEWIAFFSGLAVSVVLYIVGGFLPNNRKKVMSKIEQHFKNAPTRRQAYRG